jgi:hypothetical protein
VVGWSTAGRFVKLTESASAVVRGARRPVSAKETTGVPDLLRAPVAVEVVLVDTEPDAAGGRAASLAAESAAPPTAGRAARHVREAAAAVTQSLELGASMRALAQSLNVDAASLVEALAGALRAAPAAAPAGSLLSAGEAEALERAGSLIAMPAVSSRASIATAARAAAVEASALTVREVADMLHRSEVRIRQRLADHSLLGIRAGNAWRIPAFQFDSGAELPGWDRVMAALPQDVHPLTVARFLDRPHPDLDIDGEAASPRQWLRAGADPRPVVEIAAGPHTLP